jgi:hydrogenase maturation protease
MTIPRILIAGVGNIFLGDDAFGVEVVRLLQQRSWPDNVRVVDFGIRGLDLAYTLFDGYDALILVDATPRGRPPGTLYVIEPDLTELKDQRLQETTVETHGLDPVKVFGLVQALGGQLPWLRVVGCEPATLGSEEDPALGLSAPVLAAVDEAVRMVEALLEDVPGVARCKVNE